MDMLCFCCSHSLLFHDLPPDFNKNNTTGATIGAGTALPFQKHRRSHAILVEFVWLNSQFICVLLCRPLVVFFFFCPLYCLDFDLLLVALSIFIFFINITSIHWNFNKYYAFLWKCQKQRKHRFINFIRRKQAVSG
jgi:hypothetical protein